MPDAAHHFRAWQPQAIEKEQHEDRAIRNSLGNGANIAPRGQKGSKQQRRENQPDQGIDAGQISEDHLAATGFLTDSNVPLPGPSRISGLVPAHAGSVQQIRAIGPCCVIYAATSVQHGTVPRQYGTTLLPVTESIGIGSQKVGRGGKGDRQGRSFFLGYDQGSPREALPAAVESRAALASIAAELLSFPAAFKAKPYDLVT